MREILPKKRPKEQAAERLPPTSFREKKLLLTGLVRCRSLFESVMNQLTSAHFGEGDRGLGLVWAMTLEHYQQYKDLPGENELTAAVENAMSEDGTYSAEETAVTDRAIQQMFLKSSKYYRQDSRRRYVTDLVKKLMHEHVATKAVDALDFYGDKPAHLSITLKELQQESQSIDSLSLQGVGEAFPSGWTPKSIGKKSTQLPFLDRFLNGGHAGGEIYFNGGPYGSCKTTIGVQLGVECAREFAREWALNGKQGPLDFWAHFSTEEPADSLRLRSIACTALVDRKLLEDPDEWREFSTTGNLKDYERKRYAEALRRGLQIPGERERVQHAIRILNRNWHLIDFTGHDPNLADASTNLVDGMRSALEMILRQNPHKRVGGITLDYAGALARRYLIAKQNGDFSQLRHILSMIALQLKDLSQEFNCPIWCFHQLSGAANSRSRKGLPDHTDAAENKAFGENFDFCFVNTIVNEQGLCVMACTKARRAQLVRETVVRVEGEHSRVVSVDGDFVFDRGSQRIVGIKEYNNEVRRDELQPGVQDDHDEASCMKSLKSGKF